MGEAQILLGQLPQSDITLGKRGHPGADRYFGEIPSEGHLFCRGRVGGQIPRVGQSPP